MHKSIMVAAMLLTSTTSVFATDYFTGRPAAAEYGTEYASTRPASYEQTVRKVDVSKYAPPELEIKKALLRALLYRGWEITAHTRYKVTVKYKYTTMTITMSGQTVEFREVSPALSQENSWVTSAADNFMVDLEYFYHVRLAEQMISGNNAE